MFTLFTLHSAMDESRRENLAKANSAKRMKADLKADLELQADKLKAEISQLKAENGLQAGMPD